jgi:tRNA pseudouridine38-40 synthase
MVYRLTLSYAGGAYAGWQRQGNALAIQQVVEEALAKVLQREVLVTAAGRTDAGVHARGQVAHLEINRSIETDKLLSGTNHHLPRVIRVMAVEQVGDDFHARKSARAKEYLYRLTRLRVISPLDAPYVVGTRGEVDVALMRQASDLLPGEHDFSAFALAGGAHSQPRRRVLEVSWQENGPELEFRILGVGFLRGMVRSLVGTLLEVGRGQRSVENFAALLEGAPRSEAGPTAPAHGLVLMQVFYSAGTPEPGGSGPF